MSAQASDDALYLETHLALQAMRDNGYKNTAYALAELIDNSIQAEATQVELFCLEENEFVEERFRWRLSKIAVLDNGSGMDLATLRRALQFGNGSYRNDRSGIGRFGMGLPASSISQGSRVDVWTWQAGPDSAIHTYLDLDEIKQKSIRSVPVPQQDPLPEEWRQRAEDLGAKGTIVVWSKLDRQRLTWAGASATLKNTALEAGRMYRYFIHRDQVRIRLVSLRQEDGKPEEVRDEQTVRPNDPLYLMAPSMTPSPYDDKPMFQKYQPGGEGTEWEYRIPVPLSDGSTSDVLVRAAVSLPGPRRDPVEASNRLPGSTNYGKHAGRNMGVSLLRTGRELFLDSSWGSGYDPVDRWWGIEVEFDPVLDEVFGVPNNKQEAVHFVGLGNYDWKDEAEPGESRIAFKERLQTERDPKAPLLDLVDLIERLIKEMRQVLKDQTKGQRTPDDGSGIRSVATERQATEAGERRANEGHRGETDTVEPLPDEDMADKLETSLKEKDYDPEDARDIAHSIVDSRARYTFALQHMPEVPAFFTVEFQAQMTIVTANTAHPFHEQLKGILQPTTPPLMSDREMLGHAADALWLMLCAWARMEDEEIGKRERLRELRGDWGRLVNSFLRQDYEDDDD